MIGLLVGSGDSILPMMIQVAYYLIKAWLLDRPVPSTEDKDVSNSTKETAMKKTNKRMFKQAVVDTSFGIFETVLHVTEHHLLVEASLL